MKNLKSWKSYAAEVSELEKFKKVDVRPKVVYFEGIITPIRVYWEDLAKDMPRVRESVGKVISAFERSFSGADVTTIQSPEQRNPQNRFQIYSATLAARDVEGLCADVRMDVGFEPEHENFSKMKRAYSAEILMTGTLASGRPLSRDYERTSHFLRNCWSQIGYFIWHREMAGYDVFNNGLFVELKEGVPVCGGENLTRKLGIHATGIWRPAREMDSKVRRYLQKLPSPQWTPTPEDYSI